MTSLNYDNTNNFKNTFNYAAGGVAGWATYQATKNTLRRPYNRYYCDCFEKITTNEHKIAWDKAQEVFSKKKMNTKGVSFEILNENTVQNVLNRLVSATEKNAKPRKKLWYYLFGPSKKEKAIQELIDISKGDNACYFTSIKKISLNPEKRGLSAFHEMGHALNNTEKGIGKNLQNMRKASKAIPFVLAYGLLTNKKDNPKYFDEKIENFIKNNCGLIMFTCMVPTLLEEGLASIKGAKLAKPELSKNMYEKLCKSYTRAWGTYATAAAAIGICGAFAVYIRDKIVEKKSS